MINKINFGLYLKKLRNSKGLTISELAKISDVSPSYISRIEKGNRNPPHPEVLQKLAHNLNVGYLELMLKAGHIPEDSDALLIDDDQTKHIILNMSESKKILFEELDCLDEETIYSFISFIKTFKRNFNNKDSN